MTGLREVSSSNRKSVMVPIMSSRLKILPQLSDRLKGMLDQSATADRDVRLTLQSDSQRPLFGFHANERAIESRRGGDWRPRSEATAAALIHFSSPVTVP